MDELTKAPEELGLDDDIEAEPPVTEHRPTGRRFGANAVPLRHTSGRDAALEGEERLRLVAAGSRRRSPHRRLGALAASGLVLVGLLVLVVVHMIGGGSGAAPFADRKGPELQRRPNQSAVVPTPSAGQRGADVRTASRHVKRHRHETERRHDRGAARKRARREPHEAKASRSAPEPQSESAPSSVPEPEVTPSPEPAPEPEPEVTQAAEPESAPEPTSSPESKTTEPSEVEAQFGFQK